MACCPAHQNPTAVPPPPPPRPPPRPPIKTPPPQTKQVIRYLVLVHAAPTPPHRTPSATHRCSTCARCEFSQSADVCTAFSTNKLLQLRSEVARPFTGDPANVFTTAPDNPDLIAWDQSVRYLTRSNQPLISPILCGLYPAAAAFRVKRICPTEVLHKF